LHLQYAERKASAWYVVYVERAVCKVYISNELSDTEPCGNQHSRQRLEGSMKKLGHEKQKRSKQSAHVSKKSKSVHLYIETKADRDEEDTWSEHPDE